MLRLILIVAILLTLSSCFLRPHKTDIEQGNVFSSAQVSRLRTGMSEMQVRKIMGNPVLVNIFTPNRIDYVYTYQKAYQPLLEKRVICLFSHGKLTEVIRS